MLSLTEIAAFTLDAPPHCHSWLAGDVLLLAAAAGSRLHLWPPAPPADDHAVVCDFGRTIHAFHWFPGGGLAVAGERLLALVECDTGRALELSLPTAAQATTLWHCRGANPQSLPALSAPYPLHCLAFAPDLGVVLATGDAAGGVPLHHPRPRPSPSRGAIRRLVWQPSGGELLVFSDAPTVHRLQYRVTD